MTTLKHMLIFGGSFDPPHLGHLNTALKVQQYFHFDRFEFLPCKTPVLKQPTQASSTDRFNMLNLMLKHYPEFIINTREIDRDTPSYMSETLKSIRKDFGDQLSITLLLGVDAFLTLNQWHAWEKIPTLCNLLVMDRQGIENHRYTRRDEQAVTMTICRNPLDLLQTPYGHMAYFDAGQYPISSTNLREKIHSGLDVKNNLYPTVNDYINQHGLYL